VSKDPFRLPSTIHVDDGCVRLDMPTGPSADQQVEPQQRVADDDSWRYA